MTSARTSSQITSDGSRTTSLGATAMVSPLCRGVRNRWPSFCCRYVMSLDCEPSVWPASECPDILSLTGTSRLDVIPLSWRRWPSVQPVSGRFKEGRLPLPLCRLARRLTVITGIGLSGAWLDPFSGRTLPQQMLSVIFESLNIRVTLHCGPLACRGSICPFQTLSPLKRSLRGKSGIASQRKKAPCRHHLWFRGRPRLLLSCVFRALLFRGRFLLVSHAKKWKLSVMTSLSGTVRALCSITQIHGLSLRIGCLREGWPCTMFRAFTWVCI